MRYPGVDFGSARIEGRFPAPEGSPSPPGAEGDVSRQAIKDKPAHGGRSSRLDGQSTVLSKSYQLGEMDHSGQDSLIEGDAVRAVGVAVHEQARPYPSAGDEFANFNCTGRKFWMVIFMTRERCKL